MFDACSVMIIGSNALTEEIFRLELDEGTQQAVCITFSEAVEGLVSGKDKVIFDGSYKPHQDEFLTIENFQLSDLIKDAIRDPLGVQAYCQQDGAFPEIKAIFVGARSETNETEKFVVAFQRFRKEQYISTKWYNLFFTNDTFRRESNFGISISDSIDCYYSNGELQFSSFFFARQVFDLSEYYRSATDQEVDLFSTSDRLSLENTLSFKAMANSWIRRKIAMINDSEVLTNYSAAKIKSLAKLAGVDLTVADKKIVIPNDKEKLKIILGFLDEEAYKGPFSQNTYLANSKRQINR